MFIEIFYTLPMTIKLSQYAQEQGVCYRTAWNRFKAGQIVGAYLSASGRICVPRATAAPAKSPKAAIYARVSPGENKPNLISQAERLTRYATANGWPVVAVVQEVGSGVNDQRKKLEKLLQDDSWNILVVEHKDRLTRFGFNHLDTLLPLLGNRIEVVNRAEDDKADLVKDLASVIYSFSVRMYGQRLAKRRTAQLIQAIQALEAGYAQS
jgi:predicted site-specific integrase-resolvase